MPHERLTQAFVNYIDSCEIDEQIFDLGDTYKWAVQHTPCDLRGVASLSSMIVELLRVAPEGRLLKSSIKICVRQARLNRAKRVTKPRVSIEDTVLRISKQVLRVRFICCRPVKKISSLREEYIRVSKLFVANGENWQLERIHTRYDALLGKMHHLLICRNVN